LNDRKYKWHGEDDDWIEDALNSNPRVKEIYERKELDDPITDIRVKA